MIFVSDASWCCSNMSWRARWVSISPNGLLTVSERPGGDTDTGTVKRTIDLHGCTLIDDDSAGDERLCLRVQVSPGIHGGDLVLCARSDEQRERWRKKLVPFMKSAGVDAASEIKTDDNARDVIVAVVVRGRESDDLHRFASREIADMSMSGIKQRVLEARGVGEDSSEWTIAIDGAPLEDAWTGGMLGLASGHVLTMKMKEGEAGRAPAARAQAGTVKVGEERQAHTSGSQVNLVRSPIEPERYVLHVEMNDGAPINVGVAPGDDPRAVAQRFVDDNIDREGVDGSIVGPLAAEIERVQRGRNDDVRSEALSARMEQLRAASRRDREELFRLKLERAERMLEVGDAPPRARPQDDTSRMVMVPQSSWRRLLQEKQQTLESANEAAWENQVLRRTLGKSPVQDILDQVEKEREALRKRARELESDADERSLHAHQHPLRAVPPRSHRTPGASPPPTSRPVPSLRPSHAWKMSTGRLRSLIDAAPL